MPTDCRWCSSLGEREQQGWWLDPMESDSEQGDRSEAGLRTRASAIAHVPMLCHGDGLWAKCRVAAAHGEVP